MLLLDALVKLGASLDTQQVWLVASLSASDSGHGRGTSLAVASCNRRGCGCRSWFDTGLEPERMYISTARASSSSTVYPLVKLTLEEAVAFSASAALPFLALQLKVSCKLPSNQVLQRRDGKFHLKHAPAAKKMT